MKPAAAIFPILLIVGSGCFGAWDHGCFTDGGTAVWYQEGVFAAMQQAAANESDARRTLLQTQAGIAFPHAELEEIWGKWYRLEQIGHGADGSGPLVSLDLTEKPPVVRAATFSADIEAVRQRATAFLKEIAEPGEDIEGWVEDFITAADHQGRGEGRFYTGELRLDLRLLERFNATLAGGEMHPDTAQAMRWSDDGLAWTFSILAQDVWKPGHLAVRSNTGDWVFTELNSNPEGETDAQEKAGQNLAAYNITASGFDGWRFDPQTVCG